MNHPVKYAAVITLLLMVMFTSAWADHHGKKGHHRLTQKLEQVVQTLDLTPVQKTAWQKVEATFQKPAKKIKTMAKTTVPDRLQHRIQMAEYRLERMRTLQKQFMQFYNQLDAKQQAKLNQMTKPRAKKAK